MNPFGRMSSSSLLLYTASSLLATSLVVYNAFQKNKQFYNAMVYIHGSPICLGILIFDLYILYRICGKLIVSIFFGFLTTSEIDGAFEKFGYATFEALFAIAIFREDFSSSFIISFSLLSFVRMLCLIFEEKVSSMARMPFYSKLYLTRMFGFCVLFLWIISKLIRMHLHDSLHSRVEYIFVFEYAFLAVLIVGSLFKAILNVIESYYETWQRKSLFSLYLESFIGVTEVALHFTFLYLMYNHVAFPLYHIKTLLTSVRTLVSSISKIYLSSKAIKFLTEQCVLLDEEQLSKLYDRTCIVCREDMTESSRKLPCDHCFHESCLVSWFRNQQSCPLCRFNMTQAAKNSQNNSARNVQNNPPPSAARASSPRTFQRASQQSSHHPYHPTQTQMSEQSFRSNENMINALHHPHSHVTPESEICPTAFQPVSSMPIYVFQKPPPPIDEQRKSSVETRQSYFTVVQHPSLMEINIPNILEVLNFPFKIPSSPSGNRSNSEDDFVGTKFISSKLRSRGFTERDLIKNLRANLKSQDLQLKLFENLLDERDKLMMKKLKKANRDETEEEAAPSL